MLHRHINTTEWTLTAIDSCLERGNLSDWRELFQAAKQDIELAKKMLRIAQRRGFNGTSVLVEALVRKLHPELFTSELT